ncbi:MAG: glycosyltransferase family 1 protein, partial [Rhodospirillales bacterium]
PRSCKRLGIATDFVTYGSDDERKFASRLPGIGIHFNRFGLGGKRYERFAPLLQAPTFWKADVVKTNQVSSWRIAVPAARVWRKPLLARAGFLPSVQAEWESGKNSPEWHEAISEEAALFSKASAAAVTTPDLAQALSSRIPALASNLHVVPNYVDTKRFAPEPHAVKDIDVLFVGRLAKQKNLPALLEALAGAKLSVAFVGQGSEQDLLGNFSHSYSGRFQWLERVAHHDLPALYNRACLLVLPSLWEGQPKVLLEAMACGTPVLGADAPGIRDQIVHQRTGWICPGNAAGLKQAFEILLPDAGLLSRLGGNARQHILETCSLEAVAAKEAALIRQLADRRDP